MDVPLAKLEEWMRRYYHHVEYDIGSSGVRDLTVEELRGICGFELSKLDSLIFHDSESFGGTRLRAALADRWAGGHIERMMVTHGSSEAIYLVMNTLLHPCDEVVVVDPAYPQLRDIAASLGCRITRWRLRSGADFVVDVTRLRELAKSRPRMIVINFPNNPTGVSLTVEQQREVVAIAAESGAWLVWDHAFGELTYTAKPLPIPVWYERCIAFGTFSKSYGLAGLRVGWCMAPPELLVRMSVLRDYIALYVSPVLEFFAEQAVRNADRIVAIQRAHAGTNLRLLQEWSLGMRGQVRFTPPDGGVTAFVQFPGRPDATEMCQRLAEQYGVLLVPGDCFGDDFCDYVRLGFGGTTTDLSAGLHALEQALLEPAAI